MCKYVVQILLVDDIFSTSQIHSVLEIVEQNELCFGCYFKVVVNKHLYVYSHWKESKVAVL